MISTKCVTANPLATSEEVYALNPLAAIAHPNCPVELWWKLAEGLPVEAQASILYPLMTLAEPDRWVQLEDDNIARWIPLAGQRLSASKQQLFAADCAERCLPLLEAQHPTDTRPRDAIQARRQWASYKITLEQWEQAQYIVEQCAKATSHLAAKTAAWAARADWFNSVSQGAARAFWEAAPEGDAQVSAWKEERHWQWLRMQQYLRGEV